MKKMIALLISISMLSFGALTAFAANGEFVLYRDNFRVPNGDELGPRNYLTEDDHAALLANFQNTEKYTANLALEDAESDDACYGMAVISMLSANGMVDAEALDVRLIDNEYLDADWHSISILCLANEAGIPERITSYINYYMMTQGTDAFRQLAAYQMYTMSDAERLQYLVKCAEPGVGVETGLATLFTVNGYLYDLDYRQSHTVLATGVEHGTYEVDGKTYDGCILVYDSDVTSVETWTKLYFNTSDWSWTMPGMGVTNETAIIDGITNDVNPINQAGLMFQTEYTPDNDFIGVLVTNELNSDYTVSKATLSNDILLYTNEPNDGMKETLNFYPDYVESAAKNFLTSDTDSGYVLDLEKPQTLDNAMYYENSLMRVQAENASQFAAEPSGYMGISGEASEYLFDMVFNDGYLCTDWYQMSVSGTADTASLQKTEDGYVLTADNLEEIKVNAKNDTVTAALSFSADADSVLLYEIDEYTIGAAIDTDGDGSYETTVAQSDYLGDVNRDGSIDATDAAAVLKMASEIGSGSQVENNTAADVNADGSINALDAAFILQYAAYAGAGGELSFEEFLKSL